MGYRKLTVGDKTYEYVIGESFTKIKGIGYATPGSLAIPNDQIGNRIGVNDDGTPKIAVTPKSLATYLAKLKG